MSRERIERHIAKCERDGERWTITTLCESLSLARGTVQGHLDRMVRDGILRPSANWVLTRPTDSKAA